MRPIPDSRWSSPPGTPPHAADDAKRTQPAESLTVPAVPGADETVAAVLAAKQFYRPADLTNRNPVMAKPLTRTGSQAPFSAKERIEAARDQGVRDRERITPPAAINPMATKSAKPRSSWFAPTTQDFFAVFHR